MKRSARFAAPMVLFAIVALALIVARPEVLARQGQPLPPNRTHAAAAASSDNNIALIDRGAHIERVTSQASGRTARLPGPRFAVER